MESFKENTMKGKKMLPIGTKVFDILFGHGEIADTIFYDERTSRISVVFKVGEKYAYNQDGKYSDHHKNPTLSLTEYTLETGGFTPISEYWTKPKVGDWGYFWDNKDEKGPSVVVFGKLIEISECNDYPYRCAISSCWNNFSHEIPKYIKQQMNNETDK